MKKIVYLLMSLTLAVLLFSCSEKETGEVEVVITNRPVSSGYIGNGVQWDPYDEAEAWGAVVTDEEWQKLFRRVGFMRPGYVRCMINSPYRYYNPETGTYDKTRNIESISRLLQYCTDHHITVMYGEYNPPTWEMKADQRWVEMSVDYLNYLVNDLGFSCIKYFVIFNEPDGDWAATNGDYDLWLSMLNRFALKMKEYPGLTEKVQFAAPDVVMDYRNSASPYDAAGWVAQTAADADHRVGVYDLHAYPGQHQLRSGSYGEILQRHKASVPEGKKVVLGEAGFKYWRMADAALMKEQLRRVEDHPFTKGSDANLLVYDSFYGLDMALLCMEVMNNGYSGIAAWMLDDAMHSNGDAGNTEDIKLWGMWNILGEEVFDDPSQEEIRPWYYTWSLMCRFFPSGCRILETERDNEEGLFTVAAELDGHHVFAAVNVSDADRQLLLRLPAPLEKASIYRYEEALRPVDDEGLPLPLESGITIAESYKTNLPAQSFLLITNMN
ncbi:MAG: hypothetical protein AAGU18_05225 [Proteiniphilum sp.]